jgi:hypothetical protein
MPSRFGKLSPTVVLMAAGRRRKARWYSLTNLPWRALSFGVKVTASVGYLLRYNFIKLGQADLANIVEAFR